MIFTMIFANFFIVLASYLIFLFIFWKRLKEDYVSEIIFSTAFLSIVGRIGFWYLGSFFIPSYFFWLALLGAILGLLVGILRSRMNFFETVDAFIFASLPTLTIIFLEDSAKNSSLTSFIAFVFTLILIFLFFVINANYKRFGWYKSGRVGISGFLVALIFFTARAISSFWGIDMLTFVTGEAYYSLGMIALSVIGILYLNYGKK